MRRFLSCLILTIAGLLFLAAPAASQAAEPPVSKEEKRRQTGEYVLLLLIAGCVGTVVVIQGAREFRACIPRERRPVNLDDYDD
jgi:uncharacterized membrane protein